jgi:hypothetical protein
MAEAVDQVQHDFWSAPVPATKTSVIIPERAATCRCGTEFIVSSLYCHACGAGRLDHSGLASLQVPGLAEFSALAGRLELAKPALIAFLLGILCVVGALTVSIFFSVRTLLDWQAIQMWRIEWLLAAVASFAAGCLLKK